MGGMKGPSLSHHSHKSLTVLSHHSHIRIQLASGLPGTEGVSFHNTRRSRPNTTISWVWAEGVEIWRNVWKSEV